MRGVTYAGINEIGDRSCQEDSIGVRVYDKEVIFAVADGLGGHGLGNLASSMVMKTLLSGFKEGCDEESFFKENFVKGNEELCRLQEEQHALHSAKTTLSCVTVRNQILHGAYIGDSRIYIFERGKKVFRTLDHSVPQSLVSAGMIKEREIRNHPDRNRLLRALGVRELVPEPQIIPPYQIGKKTAVLLCTDGFWENILETEMEKTLKKSENPGEWISKMKNIVERRGLAHKQDNYSAICVWIQAE